MITRLLAPSRNFLTFGMLLHIGQGNADSVILTSQISWPDEIHHITAGIRLIRYPISAGRWS